MTSDIEMLILISSNITLNKLQELCKERHITFYGRNKQQLKDCLIRWVHRKESYNNLNK